MNKIQTVIDNYMAIVHDLASRADQWMSRPAWLEFSTNNVCNLRCIMCPQADGEPGMVMAKEQAHTLLGDLAPHLSIITPSAGSEPVLGNIDLILKHCREHEVFIDMYSNGTILTAERFRAMADRIHKLHISFDSHIPHVFEKIRVRAKYSKVLENIKSIIPVAVELGVPMGFVFVLMSENAEQLPDYIDFLADLGIAEAKAEIRVQPMLYIAKGCDDQEVFQRYSEEQVLSILDAATERAIKHKIIFMVDMDGQFGRTITPIEPPLRAPTADLLKKIIPTVRQRYPQFCSMASYYMKVSPDGSVFPCCRAPDELCMGNVNQESVEDIWNGERYQQFRRKMFRGEYAEPCRTCNVLVGNPAFQELQKGGSSSASAETAE